MTSDERAAVAVVGGGPAGSAAARALVARGIDVVLLERSGGEGNAVGESLAPSINPLLHRLGLHDALAESGAWPCHGNRSSWGGDGAAVEHDFLRDPHGHGWHLDRSAFNAALLERAAEAGAWVWRNARLIALARSPGEWALTVEVAGEARPLIAKLLIDASGRAAVVARRLGERRRVFDRQMAAVAFLPSDHDESEPRDPTTLIEAVEDGWWYAARIPGDRLAVTLFTDPDLLAAAGTWRVDAWWQRLRSTEMVSERVARHRFGRPSRIVVRAAGSSMLPRSFGPGWIAAGDAAAAFDPLSSHGIGSALAAGEAAATAVAAALAGEDDALARYGDGILAGYAHDLWLRHAYYAEERRWPRAPFWARRHSGLALAPADFAEAGRSAAFLSPRHQPGSPLPAHRERGWG